MYRQMEEKKGRRKNSTAKKRTHGKVDKKGTLQHKDRYNVTQ